MNRKIHLIVFLAVFLSSSWLIAQESKVRVVVDRARIYAESSTESYRIETVRKGTILTLFGEKQTKAGWFYVYYQSPRWNSKVTGFVLAEVVEEDKPVEKPEEKPETKPEVKQVVVEPAPKKETVPKVKIPEPKPKKREVKEEPVRVEQALAVTSLSTHRSFPLPQSIQIGQNPRIYEIVEPPQLKILITEEELEAEVLPEGAKPIVKPKDKINTEVWEEQVVIPKETEVPEKERDIKEQEPPEITRLRPPQGRTLFTLSLGYGPSLGGFGGFIQVNTAADISVHWGIGYFPASMFYPDYDWVQGKAMYSVGVKYYLPWRTDQVRPYVDLQYGGISVEAVRVVTGVWYYTYIYEDIQKTLWGPSILAGLELRIGSFGLNGALGLSYVLTEWEYWDQPLFVTADVGFLLYF